MNQQIAQQVGIGALSLVLGVLGWLLPFEWNLLRLRRGLAQFVSEPINRVIPKIFGSILIAVGLAILLGTAIVGPFR